MTKKSKSKQYRGVATGNDNDTTSVQINTSLASEIVTETAKNPKSLNSEGPELSNTVKNTKETTNKVNTSTTNKGNTASTNKGNTASTKTVNTPTAKNEVKTTAKNEKETPTTVAHSKSICNVSDTIDFGFLTNSAAHKNAISTDAVQENVLQKEEKGKVLTTNILRNQTNGLTQTPSLNCRTPSPFNSWTNERQENPTSVYLDVDEFLVPKIIQVVSLAQNTDTKVSVETCSTASVNNITDIPEDNQDVKNVGSAKAKRRRKRRNKNNNHIEIISDNNSEAERSFEIENVESSSVVKEEDENLATVWTEYGFDQEYNRGVNHTNNILLCGYDTDGSRTSGEGSMHGYSKPWIPYPSPKDSFGETTEYKEETSRGDDIAILGLDFEDDFEEEGASGGSWFLSPSAILPSPKSECVMQPDSFNSSESGSCATSSSTSIGGQPKSTSASYSNAYEGILNICQMPNCSKPGVKKCSSCKAAFYCGEDHQKGDWKKHKHNCTPYKLDYIAEGADGGPVWAAVASRNIHAGQVILAEKPFLIFPLAADEDFTHVMDYPCIRAFSDDSDMMDDSISSPVLSPGFYCDARKPACFGCMKVVEFIGPARHQCSLCGLPLCSENCESELPHHLGECHAIINCGGLGDDEITKSCYHSLYMDVEILRALQLETYDHKLWEKFIELKFNVRVLTYKQTERFKIFAKKMRTLVPYSAKVSGYNYDLILDAHSIITALSFRPSLKSSFKLLFIRSNEFAHECVSNTLRFVEFEKFGNIHKMTLMVKASVAILKGNLITIDFAPCQYLPYPQRRKVLHNLSISNCRCRRCIEPTQCGDLTGDVICPTCRKGLISAEVPQQWEESVWSCDYCQEEYPYAFIQRVEQGCREELMAIIPMNKEGLPHLVNFVERRSKTDLNPGHGLIIMAWCFIETLLRPKLEAVREPDPHKVYCEDIIEDFKILAQYCEVVDRHFRSIFTGISIDKGILYFHKFYADFVLITREYQLKLIPRKTFIASLLGCLKTLKEALQIFTVYEGFYSSRQVMLLTQEGTSALANLKLYVEKLMLKDQHDTLVPSSRIPI